MHERLQPHVRHRRLGAGLWVLLLGGLVASIAGTATLHFACAVRMHPHCMCMCCVYTAAPAPPPPSFRTASALRPLPPPPPQPQPPPLPQVGGAALFSLYIVYDVYMISKRTSPDDYIPAAIELYLDIANLFLHILRILAAFQNDR